MKGLVFVLILLCIFSCDKKEKGKRRTWLKGEDLMKSDVQTEASQLNLDQKTIDSLFDYKRLNGKIEVKKKGEALKSINYLDSANQLSIKGDEILWINEKIDWWELQFKGLKILRHYSLIDNKKSILDQQIVYKSANIVKERSFYYTHDIEKTEDSIRFILSHFSHNFLSPNEHFISFEYNIDNTFNGKITKRKKSEKTEFHVNISKKDLGKYKIIKGTIYDELESDYMYLSKVIFVNDTIKVE